MQSSQRQKRALSSLSGILMDIVHGFQRPILQNEEVTLAQYHDSFDCKQVLLTCSVLNSELLCNSHAKEHISLTGPIRYSSGTFTVKKLIFAFGLQRNFCGSSLEFLGTHRKIKILSFVGFSFCCCFDFVFNNTMQKPLN